MSTIYVMQSDQCKKQNTYIFIMYPGQFIAKQVPAWFIGQYIIVYIYLRAIVVGWIPSGHRELGHFSHSRRSVSKRSLAHVIAFPAWFMTPFNCKTLRRCKGCPGGHKHDNNMSGPKTDHSQYRILPGPCGRDLTQVLNWILPPPIVIRQWTYFEVCWLSMSCSGFIPQQFTLYNVRPSQYLQRLHPTLVLKENWII